MAYAAVLSLNQTLEQISNPHPKPERYKTPLQDQQIKSLQEKLNSILEFMDHSWQKRSEEVRCWESEIRDAAYKVADMIDSHISMNFGQEGFRERQMRDQTFLENMEIVADEIDSIKKKVDKLKELWGATDLHQSQRTSSPAGSSRPTSSGKNAMVGFQNDLDQIKDRLTGNQATDLQIIQVTGMGGIGKTTLATNVYNDPLIEYHFDTRAWVSISQEYREREVLLSLLDSMKQLNAEMRQEMDNEKLKEYLYKSLKGMRYLLVMDDVWNSEAWDSLRMIFPDDKNRSRIMFTTRLSLTIDSHTHQMQFLNETDSWNLLRQEVFGEDFCPLELEESGKMIAKNCRGLPLSLVVMGGHLSKANRTNDHWECVAKDVKLVVTATEENCSEILSLSYDYLPHHLKACFLYMGVFPEDAKIRASKLIKLWDAEGFLKPVIGKTMEEVAEEYLGDLISRSLILISEKSSRGKIKTCGIHDLLREICITKAQEENFYHVTNKDVKIFAEGMKYSRRLCIHPGIFPKVFSNSDNSNASPSFGSLSTVRSILCSGDIYEPVDGKHFPLLRVLDLAKGKVDDFPIGEIKLVHSRYLAFSCEFSMQPEILPKILPSFPWYLQTLNIIGKDYDDKVYLPVEIWRMPQLRHLLFGYFGEYCLPCPARSPIDGENLVLGNLLTLSNVSSSSCTKEVLERVPNLNKLGISIDRLLLTPFSLGNLVDFSQLETLKVRTEYKRARANLLASINFTSPPNIKKLTLKYCRIPWKHMTVVGLMLNLEVLKLLFIAFDGPEWEPTEGEFCKLKYLLLSDIDLVQWRADDTHFKSLERLVLRRCYKLEEIPCSIGEIPTLQSIDLDDASPSAVTSAKQIQEEQEDWGNDILQVHVIPTFQKISQAREELKAEIIAKAWSNDEKLQLQAIILFCERFVYKSIDEKVTSRVVPRIFEFLDRNDCPQLQREAARAIKSFTIMSGNCNILIDHGAIPILGNLLSSPEDFLHELALDVLGYLALDSTKSRDLVLSCGVLMPILEQFNDKTNLSIVRKATKILSNLCRGGPWPQFEQMKSSILHLAELIHIDDEEVLNYACSTLSNLTDGNKDIIQAVIDAGVFPRLVELLSYPSLLVTISAEDAIYNIISNGDDIQIQVIIDSEVLPCLINLLTKNYNHHVKEAACSVVSSIIQRAKDQNQAVIEAGIISPLLQLLQNDDLRIQRAAGVAISHAIIRGTNEQIKFLVHQGCVKPLCDLLAIPNMRHYVIKNCLEGFENILKVGEAEKRQGCVKPLCDLLVRPNGNVFAQIKNLQTHPDRTIRELAMRILETYWQEKDTSGCFRCTFIDHFRCFLP